jgi:hypothetical protein
LRNHAAQSATWSAADYTGTTPGDLYLLWAVRGRPSLIDIKLGDPFR